MRLLALRYDVSSYENRKPEVRSIANALARLATADKAATKAMPINRAGDFGLAPGISGRFALFQTVDFSTIFAHASAPRNSWISCNMRLNAITLICILLFIGAAGKSALVGSHTWSPDAMEGPTPVSALIHGATMVGSGTCRPEAGGTTAYAGKWLAIYHSRFLSEAV
ncbi:hypothetical protein NE237_018135 [Protea cynaroides]|uniref:NADH:quinone oxidoreductase/Mrp antiporter transmembrane domain-containing protein n=1 Tax=Protea cynaroides TaxID=273540 RepID=A0A9Q0K9G1_9MAGN|nr:hypothetical protein NE237_018135 [Protea cynaroides]